MNQITKTNFNKLSIFYIKYLSIEYCNLYILYDVKLIVAKKSLTFNYTYNRFLLFKWLNSRLLVVGNQHNMQFTNLGNVFFLRLK